MRAAVVVLLLAPAAFAQSLDVQGYVAARAMSGTGPASWLDGGIGRLEHGEGDEARGVAQLGFEWTPSDHFDVHVSGAADQDDAGLVEAYADARLVFGLDELQLRAGQFFLPTSRENRGELWTSPYSMSFSALNTWVAEEVRPVGADLEWRHTLQSGHVLTTGATAFRGNDTMGALLGWRGWSVGTRLSTWGEVLPIPPQPSFPHQRTDGTKPFGDDLDGRTGYAARVRYSAPQRASVQYAYLDNRGDRKLYRGEYAWETDFHVVGAEVGNPDAFVAAAEAMRGRTGMGIAPVFVQAEFYAAYALLSDKRGRNRWTARYDLFGVEGNRGDESGRSWMLAWLFDVTSALRLGAELTQVTGDNFAGQDTTGRNVTLELRYTF